MVNLTAYTFLAFHSVAYDQNIPVFLSYPVKEHNADNTKLPFKFTGGFGLDPGDIGTIFTVYGIMCCIVQFVAYPPLATHFGVLRCLRITCKSKPPSSLPYAHEYPRLTCSALIMPIVYFLTPYATLFPTQGTRIAALLIIMILKAFCVIIAFPSTTILLTNSCTSLKVLGTLNGFATMFSGLGRALGPFSTGVVFDWGAEQGFILSAYWFLGLVAVLGAIPVYLIVEGEGPTASTDSSDSEDADSVADSSLVSVNGIAVPEEAVADDEDVDGPAAPLMRSQNGYGGTDRRSH